MWDVCPKCRQSTPHSLTKTSTVIKCDRCGTPHR